MLKINGEDVVWRKAGGAPLKLTWTLAKSPSAWNEAVNCGQMTPITSLRTIPVATIKEQIMGAMEYWAKQSSTRFEFVEDEAHADVVIGFQKEPRGIAYADVLMEPSMKSGRRNIARGLICLNPQAAWKVGLNGDLKTFDIRYVVAHEIGHVLGLDHPNSPHQLMSFRYDERNAGLRSGDLAGIEVLYGGNVASSGLSERKN